MGACRRSVGMVWDVGVVVEFGEEVWAILGM